MSAAGACTTNLYEVNRAPTLCEFLTQDTSMTRIEFAKDSIHISADERSYGASGTD
jgi:hypothetical protein